LAPSAAREPSAVPAAVPPSEVRRKLRRETAMGRLRREARR
jgi:hypothetical protein